MEQYSKIFKGKGLKFQPIRSLCASKPAVRILNREQKPRQSGILQDKNHPLILIYLIVSIYQLNLTMGCSAFCMASAPFSDFLKTDYNYNLKDVSSITPEEDI